MFSFIMYIRMCLRYAKEYATVYKYKQLKGKVVFSSNIIHCALYT